MLLDKSYKLSEPNTWALLNKLEKISEAGSKNYKRKIIIIWVLLIP